MGNFENFEILEHIAEELAQNINIEYAGSVLRPHASQMWKDKKLTEDGEGVLKAAKRAGAELIKNGTFSKETLKEISRPLISEEKLRRTYNIYLKKVE